MLAPALAVWLGLTSAVAPSVVVIPFARENPMPKAEALLLANRVAAVVAPRARLALGTEEAVAHLAQAGIRDGYGCEGKKECMAFIGAALKAQAVVGVETGQVDQDISYYVEVFSTDDGHRVATQSFVLAKSASGEALAHELEPLLTKLVAYLGALTPSDAPKLTAAPTLVPRPANPPVMQAAAPSSGPSALTLVSGVGALGTGAAAVVFAVLGQQQKDTLDQIQRAGRSDLPRSQVQQIAANANSDFTIALACGVVSGALAVTTAFLWAAN